MAITQRAVMWFVIIAGAAVLVSYVLGIARAKRPADLWGGVTPSMQMAIVPVMLLAGAGFIAYAWVILFRADVAAFAALRWPWASSDGQGGQRLLLAFAVFLIPSAFWLETTLIHLRAPQAWTPALVIGVLALVAVGDIMLGLLAVAAYNDGVAGAGWMIAGAALLGLQVIVNDLVIWVWKFPW